MNRLQPLSEADVRLRLYPSTGRVVKVTEGYWPAADLFGCKVLVSRDATLGRIACLPTPTWITVDALLADEARHPMADELQRYFRSETARHFRLRAMGMPCDCTICRRGSDGDR